MKISPIGAVVGAIAGAVGRGLVVAYWLGAVSVLSLPSAGIGVLVGAIAGCARSPLWGAGLGFILSAVVFELFMLTCASVLGAVDHTVFRRQGAGLQFLTQVLPYTLQMGLAGALAGAIGSYAGRFAESQSRPTADASESKDQAAP